MLIVLYINPRLEADGNWTNNKQHKQNPSEAGWLVLVGR